MAADGSVVIEILADDKQAQSKFEKFKGVAHSALSGITGLVAGAATAVTGLAGAAAKVGSGFEASMSQVAATMGITTEELANGSESFDILSKAAKDAGATTAFSASEAAEALNYLALAGYDAETAAEALPAVLNLAAAGSMDLAYASDLATDAMAALGIEASNENLTRFGDEMARTASKANTSVSQLGEAILTVGGTAKSLAGGTVELNAALGVLANRGIKGAEGGTALRNVILALSAPTDKAASAIKGLGVEVYDATGNMRPLNEVFKDLNASMEGMSEGEKTQVLNEIFNKVDLKSAQALLAGCGEEFDNLADAIANSGGAMQDMADTQLDNLQGDITILKSGLEGLGISAYETMQGPLRETVQSVTGMVGEIASAMSEGGLEGAVGAVGNVLAKIVAQVANAAPMMINAGVQLLQSLLGGIQQNLPELVSGAVGIVTSLVNGIIAPLPELEAAAVQLILALSDGIAAALPELVPAAVSVVLQLVTTLTEPETLGDLVDAALQIIIALAEGIIAALPEVLRQAPVIIMNLVIALVENAPKLVAAALEIGKDIVMGVWDGICTMASWLKEKVTGFFSGIVSGVKEFLGIHSPSKVFADIGSNTIEGYAEGVDNGADANTSRVLSAVSDLSSGMTDALGAGGGDAGAELMNTLTSSAASALPSVSNVATASVKTFCDEIHGKQNDFRNVGVDAMKGLNEGLWTQGQEAIATARAIANSIIAEMQRAMDIHSPSRKMRDLVGKPTGEGFMVGFEDAMADFHRRATTVVNAETGRISSNVSAQADGNVIGKSITKEVHTTNNTVEKIVGVEAEGDTGDIIRALGIRLKAEDRRVGDSLDDDG